MVHTIGPKTGLDPRVCLSSVGVRLIRLRRISRGWRVQVSDCRESGIRTRSQAANKGLNRARSANLVLVSACKTRELILSDLHSVFQMRRLESVASSRDSAALLSFSTT